MEIAILAGGLGTRLTPILGRDTPKPLARINGTPFLLYLLNKLKREKFNKIILSCGYRAELFMEYIRSEEVAQLGLDIQIVREDPGCLLGTGGATLNVLEHIVEEDFMVINGDTFSSANLASIAQHHIHSSADVTIGLYHSKDTSRYGVVRTGSDGRILEFHSRGESNSPGLINSGIYVFKKRALLSYPKSSLSLEGDLLPSLISNGTKVIGIGWRGYFIDIGVPKDFYKFVEDCRTLDSLVGGE